MHRDYAHTHKKEGGCAKARKLAVCNTIQKLDWGHWLF